MEKQQIIDAYIAFVGKNLRRPTSVYEFTSESGLNESEFRAQYDAKDFCEKLEQSAWLGFFEQALVKASSAAEYEGYSAREKILSYYYNLLEVLKANSEFCKFTIEKPRPDWKNRTLSPNFLRLARPYFEELCQRILQQGYDTGEVLQRAFVSDYYKNILLVQLITILFFWKSDNSFQAERTDAFVEKSVHFAFDVFGSTPLDSGFEWIKFLAESCWKK